MNYGEVHQWHRSRWQVYPGRIFSAASRTMIWEKSNETPLSSPSGVKAALSFFARVQEAVFAVGYSFRWRPGVFHFVLFFLPPRSRSIILLQVLWIYHGRKGPENYGIFGSSGGTVFSVKTPRRAVGSVTLAGIKRLRGRILWIEATRVSRRALDSF